MMTPPARLIRLHLRSRQAAATASVTAASTRTPFSEGARTASASLPLLRLTHMTALLTAAAALFATALTTGTHTIGASTMLRNLAGNRRLALLTAVLLGPHLCWTLPVAYVVVCGNTLDAKSSSLWTLPNLPASDHTTILIAAALLVAGLVAVTLVGPQSHNADRS